MVVLLWISEGTLIICDCDAFGNAISFIYLNCSLQTSGAQKKVLKNSQKLLHSYWLNRSGRGLEFLFWKWTVFEVSEITPLV